MLYPENPVNTSFAPAPSEEEKFFRTYGFYLEDAGKGLENIVPGRDTHLPTPPAKPPKPTPKPMSDAKPIVASPEEALQPQPPPSSAAKSKKIDFDEVKRLALDNIDDLVESWFPDGEQRGKEYVTLNILRDDENLGSFSINLETGTFADFADDNVRGGNLLDLACFRFGLKPYAAARGILYQLGKIDDASAAFAAIEDRVKPTSSKIGKVKKSAADDLGEPLIPVPANAPKAPSAKFYKASKVYEYRSLTGALNLYMRRYDEPDGRKHFSPLSCFHVDGELKWESGGPKTNRPLYGLERLGKADASARIVILEGEKSADEAQKIFSDCVCMTSAFGSNAPTEKSDWTPLRGRDVVVWRDLDEAGAKYQEHVAKALVTLGCTVSVVDVEVLALMTPDGSRQKSEAPKKGWDCADAAEEWADLDALRKAVEGLILPYAPPVEEPAKPSTAGRFMSFGPFKMHPAKGLTFDKLVKEVVESVPVSGPFEIIGKGRSPDGKNWGLLIRWADPDGRVRQRFIPDEFLHGDKGVLCGSLARDGLKIFPSAAALLVAYFANCKIDNRVTIVSRTGWHDIGDQSVFALPAETIGPVECGQVVLDEGAYGPYSEKRTLDDWKAGVGAASSGHLIPMLAISTALAGPLLHLIGLEGGGIHLWGASSTGKTTAAQAAASVWGRGDSRGFVRGWSSTANGIEAVAASASDTCLVLDEFSMVDPRAAESIIYALGNGAGRQRMARDTSLREVKNWRVPVVSTGEITVAQKISETGKKAKAGQLVRMLDISADRGKGHGAFDHDGAATADALKKAAVEAYGTAGPEFVRRIVAKGLDDTRKAVTETMAGFVKAHVPANADGQVARAAQRFAAIAAAGELAIEFGLVPWRKGDASKAAAWALAQWIDQRGGTGAAEKDQAIRQVRLFLERHGQTRFDNIDTCVAKVGEGDKEREVEKPRQPFGFRDRAGYRSDKAGEFYVLPEVWRSEVCQGLDPQAVARTLLENGILRKGAKDELQIVKRIRGAADGEKDALRRVYAIKDAVFDQGEQGQKADEDPF